MGKPLTKITPFIDGNKHTAFAATFTFLAMNHIAITAEAQDTYTFIARLFATNSFVFPELLEWLRDHTALG